MGKRMDVLVESDIFEPLVSMSIIAFLRNFKTACDGNGIHEAAVICLFLHFMKEPARAAFSYWMNDTEDKTTSKEGVSIIHCKIVRYLLEFFATEDSIAEAEADIVGCEQRKNVSAVHYSGTVCKEAVRCRRVSGLKSVFVQVWHQLIRFSTKT